MENYTNPLVNGSMIFEMDNTTNATQNISANQLDENRAGNISIAVLFSLNFVSVVTIISNLFLTVVFLQLKAPRLRPSTKYILIYGAISQLCLGVAVVLRQFLGHISSSIAGIYSSSLVVNGLFLLSLDCFIAINKPYTYKFILTPRNSILAILLTVTLWTLLALVSPLAGVEREAETSFFAGKSMLSPVAIIIYSTIILMVLLLTMYLSLWSILLLRRISSKVGSMHQGNNTQSNPVAIFQISNPTQVHLQAAPKKKNTLTTRQERLVRLLTVSLLITFLCWTPTLLVRLLTGIYDVYGMDISDLKYYKRIFGPIFMVDGLLHSAVSLLLSKEIRATAIALLVRLKVLRVKHGQ